MRYSLEFAYAVHTQIYPPPHEFVKTFYGITAYNLNPKYEYMKSISGLHWAGFIKLASSLGSVYHYPNPLDFMLSYPHRPCSPKISIIIYLRISLRNRPPIRATPRGFWWCENPEGRSKPASFESFPSFLRRAIFLSQTPRA